MTFDQIKTYIYRRCGYSASPVAEVVARVAESINEVHEEILSNPALRSLLYGSLTFDSVASRARYGIPTQAQVRSMTDAANQQPITPRSLAWYRARNPAPALNEGTPEWYIPLGIVSVQQVPATTGTGLWVVSTSGTDTAGPTVTIDAIRVGGYPHSPTATALTGLTRVQIGTLTDYVDVTQFQLSAACVGDISLYDASSSGNLLATIPRGTTTSRYWGFLLCLTPSSALTYTLDVEHEIFTLSAANDEPMLPPRFHRLVAIGGKAKEYEKTGDGRYAIAQKQFDDGVDDLVYQVTCPPGFTVVPGGGHESAGSNLGPWFPPGRW